MLAGIDIENFKAFGERTHIDFAPITLIFGENSAGKTTILHSLNLLKQTRESRDQGALLLPRAEGGLVDLGGFQELLFDHDLSRLLKLRFIFDLEKHDNRVIHRMKPWNDQNADEDGQLSLELVFSRPSEKDEIRIIRLELSLGDSEEPFAIFKPETITPDTLRRVSRDFRMIRHFRRQEGRAQFQAMRCVHVSSESRIWDILLTHFDPLVPKLQKYLSRYLSELTQKEELEEAEEYNLREEYEREIRSVREALDFYSSQPTFQMKVERMKKAQLDTIIGLDGFIPFNVRIDRTQAQPEEVVLRKYVGLRIGKFDFLNVGRIAGFGGNLLEEVLDRLFPMGPFRRPPERWYIFAGTNPYDVGYNGELLPDLLYRQPRLVEKANTWLDRLDIGYQLVLRPVGTRSRDLFEVRLRDTRRKEKVEVGLSDVGFGISQLLPFIVQSLCGNNRIIAIEQPEVHVHPKLQADIGDLLAEAIKEPYQHRFIIETHSEHLILRLQSLVRNQVLSPDDVSVIYVSRGDVGAKAKRLHLDEEGEFVDDWPGGFFTERLRELM